MTRVFFQAGLALLALLSCRAAFADVGSANACAAGLAPAAKAIYDAAAPEFATSPVPRGLLRAKTVDLVKAGMVKEGEARADAMAAG